MASIINSTTTNGVTVQGDNSGSLQLATNNGTTAVTIDTSQNVGIGTASPNNKLDVQATTAKVSVTSTTGTNTTFYSANNTGGSFYFGLDNSAGTEFGTAYAGAVYRSGAYPITFYTNAAERMRIASDGFVGINATPVASGIVSGRLLVSASAANGVCSTASGLGGYRFVSNALSDEGTFFHMNIVENGTQRGSITSNGSATAYNTTSDYRLKENIKPMVGALEKVSQLKPCTYTWKSNGSVGEGFIAHELQALIPQAVTGEKDAVDAEGSPKYQMVDTSFLVATLTAAIQELKAELDATKAEVQALKGVA